MEWAELPSRQAGGIPSRGHLLSWGVPEGTSPRRPKLSRLQLPPFSLQTNAFSEKGDRLGGWGQRKPVAKRTAELNYDPGPTAPKGKSFLCAQGLFAGASLLPGAGEQGGGMAVSWWQGAQRTRSRRRAGGCRQLSLRKRLQGGPFSSADPTEAGDAMPASRALCLEAHGAHRTHGAAQLAVLRPGCFPAAPAQHLKSRNEGEGATLCDTANRG